MYKSAVIVIFCPTGMSSITNVYDGLSLNAVTSYFFVVLYPEPDAVSTIEKMVSDASVAPVSVVLLPSAVSVLRAAESADAGIVMLTELSLLGVNALLHETEANSVKRIAAAAQQSVQKDDEKNDLCSIIKSLAPIQCSANSCEPAKKILNHSTFDYTINL